MKYSSSYLTQLKNNSDLNTLLQATKYGAFATWPGITAKLISRYLPESDIPAKGPLDHEKKRPAAAASANVTPLATREGENKNEVLLQLFDPTEKQF